MWWQGTGLTKCEPQNNYLLVILSVTAAFEKSTESDVSKQLPVVSKDSSPVSRA